MSELQSTPLSWFNLRPRLARYLPASFFNRLQSLPDYPERLDSEQQRPIATELLNVQRSLEPLHRVLVQYMPRYLLELKPVPGQPHGQLLEGSFIFADVTGFTALTELMSRQKQGRGLEAMNQIMKNLFSTVLDPLIASGGDLLVFVGDAVLIYFPKQPQEADILQAIRAALRMERAILPFANLETEFGRCSLTMSAGVERGSAYAAVVGTTQRMELLVSGQAIYGATIAEQLADPGQVALGEQALALAERHFTLNNRLVVDDLGESLGDYEIAPPTHRTGGAPIMGLTIPEMLQILATTLQRIEWLAPFLPEDMLTRLVNNERQRQLPPELRPVAVQFINLIGLEELVDAQGSEVATRVFQRYFVHAYEIINRHGGVISQIDAYVKGFILVNTFGSPRAHEGTNRYAIAAALQLAHLVEQLNRELELDPPLQQRFGMTHDLIFTGEIGATYRRDSVIAGPAVNRAARLMSKAQPGQIILDSDLWDKARTAFVGEDLPPVTLKGIDGPVVIVNVREIRRGTRLPPPDRPLLNRQAEQARLTKALEAMLDPDPKQGNAWLITGETGLGKTALVAYLADLARQCNLPVLVGRCQPHGQHLPLFPWLDMLTGWLNFDEDSSPELQRVRLVTELAALGLSVEERTLAALMQLPAPDQIKDHGKIAPADQTASTNQMSLFGRLDRKIKQETTPSPPATGWQTLLQQHLSGQIQNRPSLWTWLAERVSGPNAIGNLIKKLAEREPLILILEDIDWLDPDSAMLLNDLLAQLSNLPLLILLTRRESVQLAGKVSHLSLPTLPEEILTKIAARALGGETLDKPLTQWLNQRAGGNPLYIEELCEALQRAQAVWLNRETGEVCWTGMSPDLPISLHGLLLARLDELAVAHQEVLKRAAVMGLSFEYDGLLELCRPQLTPTEVEAALEAAEQGAFITAITATTYQFKHLLLPETIYATLTFSQRQKWHTQLGDWLGQQQGDSDQLLELIAYHYLRGQDMEKAAQFGLRAGDRARVNGAYVGAADFYSLVLALSDAPPDILGRAAEGKADSLALQGDYPAALAAYDQAIALGSPQSAGKQAILAGDAAAMAQQKFSPELQLWAVGARAWLLAERNQPEMALQLLQPAVEIANDLVRPFLETLRQALVTHQVVGPYQEWLEHFSQAVLTA